MEYLEKLKVYGDQVKNVVVKSMVDTAHGGQKMLKDVLPGNLVTREFEVEYFQHKIKKKNNCFIFEARPTTRICWSRTYVEDLWSN